LEKVGYVSLRYERNKILLSPGKVDLSLGGSVQTAYLQNSSLELSTSSEFPFYYSGLHTKFALIPRALFKFERFEIDFNLPYSVMQINLSSYAERDPAVPIEEQSSGSLDFELFPPSYFLQARLGIAVDLN